MQSADLTWQQILALLQVPTHPRVFVLGSFASRVTVYSQQVRALNLVDALVSTGRVRRGSSVAIVGAGAGGLTAASALLKLGLKDVRVFEEHGQVLPIQRSSRARHLHPHIYDWPLRKLEETQAKLPVLDWEACYAAELAARFEKAWEQLCARCGVHDALLEGRAKVTLTGDGCLVGTPTEAARLFDMVILAAGFGVENTTHTSYPYWADIPADDPRFHTRSWLVSGAGDGALTDVMRLGVRGLNHDEILKRVVGAVQGQPEALRALTAMVEQGLSGTSLFESFDAEQIANQLPLRSDAVILNTDEATLFGTSDAPARSSVLNRLITWTLLQRGKVQLRSGRLDVAGIQHTRDGWSIGLKGPDTSENVKTQELLVRHGPVPSLPKNLRAPVDWLEGDTSFWRSLRTLRTRWEHLYAEGKRDPTLQREHWSDDDFVPERLSVEFGPGSALLLHCGAVAPGLANSIAAAVGTLDAPAVARVEALDVDLALRDARKLGRAIRAICQAPIVVVDITKQDVGVLWLLGIRAASRRGITVAIVCDTMSAERWDKLAFSLRSLRVVADEKPHDLSFEHKLMTCLRTGRYRWSQRSDYLDLPIFDVVRNIGVRPDEYAPLSPAVQTLVLCPFDEPYSEELWPEMQRAVRKVHGKGKQEDEGPARRALDLESPEVLERRLYEAIRRCDACIFDLTLDRGNVYFELGVRMAVNSAGAMVVRAERAYASEVWSRPRSKKVGPGRKAPPRSARAVRSAAIPGPSESSRRLDALLGTLTYTKETLIETLGSTNAGEVSRGFVFEAVRDIVAPELELGGRGVEEVLRGIADSAVGPDPLKDATSPLLFGGNPAVLKQARRLALESKIALALYRAHRIGVGVGARAESTGDTLNELEAFARNVELSQEERLHVQGIVQSLREQLQLRKS